MDTNRNNNIPFEIKVTFWVCWTTIESRLLTIIFNLDNINRNHCVTYTTPYYYHILSFLHQIMSLLYAHSCTCDIGRQYVPRKFYQEFLLHLVRDIVPIWIPVHEKNISHEQNRKIYLLKCFDSDNFILFGNAYYNGFKKFLELV